MSKVEEFSNQSHALSFQFACQPFLQHQQVYPHRGIASIYRTQSSCPVNHISEKLLNLFGLWSDQTRLHDVSPKQRFSPPSSSKEPFPENTHLIQARHLPLFHPQVREQHTSAALRPHQSGLPAHLLLSKNKCRNPRQQEYFGFVKERCFLALYHDEQHLCCVRVQPRDKSARTSSDDPVSQSQTGSPCSDHRLHSIR